MFKKEVTYIGFDSNNNEIELQTTIRFLYSLPAIRMYEERTGRTFLADYEKAYLKLISYLDGVDIKELQQDGGLDRPEFYPLLADKDILSFLGEAIPCLYGEISNGRLVQTLETAENAAFSAWFGDLLNVGFLTEIIQEMNKNSNNVPQDRKPKKNR
ncbi:TPA: hypothetical protein ACGO8F_001421 [Streptococcus suis]